MNGFHRIRTCLLVAGAVALSAYGYAVKAGELTADVDRAIRRAIPFLEREGNAWIEKRKCVSCHQVPFMLWGLNAAKDAGYELNDDNLKARSQWSLTWQSWQNPKNKNESDEASTAKGNVDTMYFVLLGRVDYEAEGTNASEKAHIRRLIIDNQQDDGSFKPGGQLPLQRRPLEETTQISTMWTLLALPPAENDPKRTTAREEALKFLEDDPSPQSTEWLVTRYLLDRQLGDDDNAEKRLKALLKAQNVDGSWGWLLDEPGDAFGTGIALYALSHVDDDGIAPAVTRAQQFLAVNQGDDGAWQVPGTKASAKGKPRDTSTYWGTAWAVIGLCATSQ